MRELMYLDAPRKAEHRGGKQSNKQNELCGRVLWLAFSPFYSLLDINIYTLFASTTNLNSLARSLAAAAGNVLLLYRLRLRQSSNQRALLRR